MADIDWASLLGTGAQIAGNVIGNAQAAGKDAQANALYQNALNRFLNLQTPSAEDTTIDESKAAGVAADPTLVAAQRAALAKMGQIERDGGLTLEDKGALNNVYNRLGQQESAQRASIANGMSARGVGGSGAELAMALQGNAEAQKSRAAQTQSVAAQAQKRYLESILQREQMARAQNSQDFGQRFSAAQAEDQRKKFNAEVPWRGANYERQKVEGAAGLNQGYSTQLNNQAGLNRTQGANYGQGAFEQFKGMKFPSGSTDSSSGDEKPVSTGDAELGNAPAKMATAPDATARWWE